MSGAEDLLRPCLPLCLVASFQLPPTPFKKNFFLLLVVFHVPFCSSLFSICALRFSLSLRLPFFRACTKNIPLVCLTFFLNSSACFLLFLPLSFGLALKYSACSPPSFLLFFAILTALSTSCPVLVLSLASLCFSFVFQSFCKR